MAIKPEKLSNIDYLITPKTISKTAKSEPPVKSKLQRKTYHRKQS